MQNSRNAKVSLDELISNELFVDRNKKKEFVSSSYIHKLQLKHFILFNLAPPILALVLGGFLFFSSQLMLTQVEVYTAILFWAISSLGITVGYHRLFTHRSLKVRRPVKFLLHGLGLIAGQGGAISWAALHRQHHKYSDKEGDPHSPNLNGDGVVNVSRGIAHSHFTWMRKHRYPNVLHYVPDLIVDKDMILMDRHYKKIFLIGLILPGLISYLFVNTPAAFLSGVLFGGLVRIIFTGNTIWAINSFLHRFGTRPFNTTDKSRNFALISPISFGEAWHNNHHAFPGSAAFGLKWYEFDPGFYLIKLLEVAGLASDVKKPTKQQILVKQD